MAFLICKLKGTLNIIISNIIPITDSKSNYVNGNIIVVKKTVKCVIKVTIYFIDLYGVLP